MVAEFLHRQITLLLRQVAMQAVGVISVGDEFVGNLLGLLAGAAEDDAVDVGVIVGDTLEGEIFVVSFHHIIDVLHVFRTLILVAGYKLYRLLHEALRDICNLLGHCGREHEHLALLGHMR